MPFSFNDSVHRSVERSDIHALPGSVPNVHIIAVLFHFYLLGAFRGISREGQRTADVAYPLCPSIPLLGRKKNVEPELPDFPRR
jgi:hypothetical protein